jgi:hypothetical protein
VARNAGRDRRQGCPGGAGSRTARWAFYFDSETGLLTRLVRYANSKVGRLPTQIDYSDYRDVPASDAVQDQVTWLDGLESIELTDVQLNAPVDAARFGKPGPPRSNDANTERTEHAETKSKELCVSASLC